MNILAIETSCDETGAAVVKDGRNILSNVVATSLDIHVKSGGIIPEKAAREQIKSLIPVVGLALKEAQMSKEDIGALAVTKGPGLVGSLLVGVESAKVISTIWEKPIVPVNHLIAHIYANWLNSGQEGKKIKGYKPPDFPAIVLVVSGGHTDLVLMKNHGRLEWLGGTRDDAAGEAFDKCARLLGLPYPGGPSVAMEAAKFKMPNSKYKFDLFPRPMVKEANFDWSFSGLKTAVLRKVKEEKNNKIQLSLPELASNVQEAIADVLVEKTLRAIKVIKPKSLLLAGGVAANARLREVFTSRIADLKLKIDFRVPAPKLCTDNAASIAACAFYNYSPLPWQNIEANPELTIAGEA